MSLEDKIGAGQASKTGAVRPVSPHAAVYIPKRAYGRIEYEVWQIGKPLMDAAFGILRGPEDLAKLINLRGTGEPSKLLQHKIDEFLRKRASKAITDLKRWLGLRRGRPLDISKQKVWATGAALRRKNSDLWTWPKITRKLDPLGYAEDARRATDRMRMGIEAWQERETRRN